MNFQNVNTMNSKMNMLSGNLLPIASTGTQFPTIWRLYQIVILLLEVIHTTALIAGCILVPREKALLDGTLCIVVILETIITRTCLFTRKSLLIQVIRKMNDLLHTADETMEDLVRSGIRMLTMPFAVYGVVSVMSVVIWTAQPIILVFKKSSFLYMDYNLPAAFSAEPFSSRVLVPSTIVMTLGSVYLFLRKFSVDIYMMHLVLLLTAQYHYVAIKLKMLFQTQQSIKNVLGKAHDRWVETQLKELCRHQNTIIQISFMMRDLLSINFSILYINSVLRFCFMGVMMSTIPSLTFLEGMSVLFFACGSAFQFFLLCFAVHNLLEASVQVTDGSFDEGWYQFGSTIKRLFILLIMSNKLKCEIAAIRKFNLSLQSFMTIMNQSYSIALLFLRAK